jgi:hypothetical protein
VWGWRRVRGNVHAARRPSSRPLAACLASLVTAGLRAMRTSSRTGRTPYRITHPISRKGDRLCRTAMSIFSAHVAALRARLRACRHQPRALRSTCILRAARRGLAEPSGGAVQTHPGRASQMIGWSSSASKKHQREARLTACSASSSPEPSIASQSRTRGACIANPRRRVER